MNESWINNVLKTVKKHDDKTFFFQSKNPECFKLYDFPQNVILAITLETNRDHLYHLISSAPPPQERMKAFLEIDHPKKRVTIEPILTFDLGEMKEFIEQLRPEITYIGFDSKKCRLPEPRLSEVKTLIKELTPFTRVKEKKMRERWQWNKKFENFKESTL